MTRITALLGATASIAAAAAIAVAAATAATGPARGHRVAPPPQVTRACELWRGLGWPATERPMTYQVPGGYLRGGNTFGDREGHLPSSGAYHEYDVNPRPAPQTHRDAERLVRDGDTTQTWYSLDHYRTFHSAPGC
ncbi:ribonuclease domain-containing protein [Actinomadura sp. DC4]|uniref:ribonuclease domain-containing protein n=1 Tax=Actinomadura sp. DC4 TaxID=3055069 RepID=UPI0025B1E06F|nr:ribonuclease domain-containing protein [Actinomadura sp. DC4]MDN3358623.1 ribonuclease domain-containing protein [Actinomadura sp. DC4]